MLWSAFAVLISLWLLGFGFHFGGSLIHVLLVLAVGLLITTLLTSARSAT